MKEFEFKHNEDGTITALRLKNNKYVVLLTFGLNEIPTLLKDISLHLPPEVRRYMGKLNNEEANNE